MNRHPLDRDPLEPPYGSSLSARIRELPAEEQLDAWRRAHEWAQAMYFATKRPDWKYLMTLLSGIRLGWVEAMHAGKP